MRQAPNREQIQDDLCSLAHGYLRFMEPERALPLLLVAMHMGLPGHRLLLLTGKCFLMLGQPDQAVAVLERHNRLFKPSKVSSHMLSQSKRAIDIAPRPSSSGPEEEARPASIGAGF